MNQNLGIYTIEFAAGNFVRKFCKIDTGNLVRKFIFLKPFGTPKTHSSLRVQNAKK